MDLKQKIGKRIKELRKSKNLSQEKLSELADIAQNSLSNIETGKTDIRYTNLLQISKAFNMPPKPASASAIIGRKKSIYLASPGFILFAH